MTPDEKLICGVIETWLEATQKGEVARVLDLMTDDIEFLVPGRPPFGKEAFAGESDGMKDVVFSGRSSVREVEVFGPFAYVRQELLIEMTPKGGAPMRLAGPTLSIFRKCDDGRWRLCRDANFVSPQ
jgi:uncharacterized protein (TIGR02246 family)